MGPADENLDGESVGAAGVGATDIGSARAEARALAAAGDHAAALFLLEQLLAAVPLEDDLRLEVAQVLQQAGRRAQAAELLEALGFHFANAGRPLRAVLIARQLAQLERDPGPIVDLVVQAYAADSPRVVGLAARRAPLDPHTPLTLRPAPDHVDLESLANRVAERARDLSEYPPYPAQLHPIPFLSELAADSLRAVVAALVSHRLEDGQTIMRQGEAGTSFFLLAAGELRVFIELPDGSSRELARLHEPSLFGEMALITRQPRAASVQAVGEAEVLEVTRDALDRLTGEIPAVQQALDRFARERLIRNLLATSPLFTPFTKDQQAELLRRFEGVEVDPGTEIIRQAAEGQGLYVVLSGELVVTAVPQADPTGAPVELATLRAGDIFGEMSLLTSQPTMAAVRAQSRCNLLFLARHYVERLAAAIPEVGSYFAAVAARRAEDNTLRLGPALPLEAVDVDVSDSLLL